ncbi:MAG: hypothetical protein U9O94_01840 [Nanoarchaeota archaeon]|nr:hypothetical protein [Nanoarchaeota archaeon]
MSKKKSKNNYGVIVGFVVIAVFAVVVSVSAVGGLVQNYYIETANITNPTSEVADSEVFGASGDNNLSSYLGLEIQDTGITIDADAWFTGAVSLGTNSTSTLGRPDATFQIPLDFTKATGTGNVAVKDTQAIIGSIQNTGARMLCNMASIDIKTANGLYNMDLQGGIATTATSSATEIAATTVSTSTTDILNKEDDEGSNTDEV